MMREKRGSEMNIFDFFTALFLLRQIAQSKEGLASNHLNAIVT